MLMPISNLLLAFKSLSAHHSQSPFHLIQRSVNFQFKNIVKYVKN